MKQTNIKQQRIEEEKKESSNDDLEQLWTRKGATETETETKVVDGNWAVAHASYRMNDVAYIFPITPSSPMGEIADEWSSTEDANGEKKYKNLWDQELKVVEMQSEGGAAGALHGALVSGSLATTYTASQGLLLFIPNLYKIAGELLPTVIHVAARALAGQALSIYGDHSDVMLARSTGVAMVSSFTVQEAHDMAIVSQIVTLNSRVPFLHFMDGFRTSHEINRIHLVADGDLRELMPWEKIEEHRSRALSPLHPDQRGTAQSPDVFFQLVESSNTKYNAVSSIFDKALLDFAHVTGRRYRPFEYHYYGSTSPSIAIVTMGSSVEVVKTTLAYLQSEEVCVIGIRLFRPWSPQNFCRVLPLSIQRVATLDRTKESGSQGEPIYLDVCASLMSCKRGSVYVAGGRYGLGSKDFHPTMVMAVIQNIMQNEDQIQHPFTVGITDDVTHLSLPLCKEVNPLGDDVTQCVFWGFGSDGTVSANKVAAKIIGDCCDMATQAYFEYDAKKSSGWTISHLRFSQTQTINAPYRIQDRQANFVACHNEAYAEANKFDVLRFAKPGGTFFLNTKIASLPPERRLRALEEQLSPDVLKTLALRKIKFFITDAGSIAKRYGLKGKINMVCMAAFFRLAGVIPFNEALSLLKESITKTYSYRGEDVVRKNHELLDAACSEERLIAVDVPSRWKRARLSEERRSYLKRHIALIDDDKTKRFMEEIAEPVSHLEGDSIPVSLFLKNAMLGGTMISGTSKFEKRRPNTSALVPTWSLSDCTQCNQCVVVCPHAAIRPFIITRDEAEGAPHPASFTSAKALGSELAGKRYTLQISPLDCTGCTACVEACPESPKALQMHDVEDVLAGGGDENWDYAVNLPERGDLLDKYSAKGSQFQTPLMEFSGACSGCGETPYFKLLTQLFGERMIIANATGCSSIWGGSFPSNPYTVSKKTGRGPAWANSLFEDNAEYGFGMFSSMKHRRSRLALNVRDFIHSVGPNSTSGHLSELVSLLDEWLEVRNEKSDRSTLLFDKMKPLIQQLLLSESDCQYRTLLAKIWADRDMFPKLSHWIVGGDGWAYDIGYGGLDHVQGFSKNDVNVLVVDTEMYSNTGGQSSKATPIGASVVFSKGGKSQTKKQLGAIFMTYEHIYVASVCLSNQSQLVTALVEADRYDGPSIVIAYAPCIQQQVRPEGLNDMFNECKLATDSGYWPLYRYNPSLVTEGKNPFILDSKRLRRDVTSFLKREGRFLNLEKNHPQIAEELHQKMNWDVQHRMEIMKKRAADYKEFSTKAEATVKVLFASETGTAEKLARDFTDACPLSHGADAMNDVDIDEINGSTTIFFVSTCGQGAMPRNGIGFLNQLSSRRESFDKGTKFSIMGLGDSSYYFFLKAALDLQSALLKLGAECIHQLGEGDDASADGGLEEGLQQWEEGIFPALGLKKPEEVPHIVPVDLLFSKRTLISEPEDDHAISGYYESIGAKKVCCSSWKRISEEGHNRDFISLTLQTGDSDMSYELGDSLEIFPTNDEARVNDFLSSYSTEFDERRVIKLSHAFGLHGEVSIGAVFTHVLDIFGKPNFSFMQKLATFEADPETRKVMLNSANLKKLCLEKCVTFADLLLMFPSARPPIAALLAMIPTIKGRAYSITTTPASSSGVIELCILINTFWSKDGGMRYGLASDMIRNLQNGDMVWCRVKPGSMEPPRHDQQVICVGIGSGLSPHLAIIRDRVYAAEKGVEVSPLSLYFGNRYKEREFLYRSELEQIATEHNDWFTLHTAFSRDVPGKKTYVQDLMAINNDTRDILLEQKGLLYVCGNRNLPAPLRKAIIESFANGKTDGKSISDANLAVEDMFINGRAQQEIW